MKWFHTSDWWPLEMCCRSWTWWLHDHDDDDDDASVKWCSSQGLISISEAWCCYGVVFQVGPSLVETSAPSNVTLLLLHHALYSCSEVDFSGRQESLLVSSVTCDCHFLYGCTEMCLFRYIYFCRIFTHLIVGAGWWQLTVWATR